jgi:hypothetical protein
VADRVAGVAGGEFEVLAVVRVVEVEASPRSMPIGFSKKMKPVMGS